MPTDTMFRSGPSFITIFLLFILFSCTPDHKNPDPETAYFDYMLWGDEESGLVTLKLQYRADGPNGESFRLDKPGKVEFDGVLIEADSAGLNGAYYEAISPVAGFEGSHRIMVTSRDGKQYKTEFDFPLISLKEELPTVVGRDSLSLELKGLRPRDTIRLLLTDTSFTGNGIERLGPFTNGRFVVRNFRDLKNGPVYVEFIHEQQIPLKTTAKGGRLSISYALKREFILQDTVSVGDHR